MPWISSKIERAACSRAHTRVALRGWSSAAAAEQTAEEARRPPSRTPASCRPGSLRSTFAALLSAISAWISWTVKSRIGLIEPDRRAVRPAAKSMNSWRCFPARRRRRVLGEFEYEIEDVPDILGEVGDVLVERSVVDGEEPDLVVLQRHELREMRRADGVQVLVIPRPRARSSNCISMKASARFGGQDHQEGRCSLAPVTSAAAARALISLAVTSG